MTWEIHEDRHEETANSILHGLGAVLSLAGLAVLVVLTASRGTVWGLVSATVFGVSMFLLYLSSSLYHGLVASKAKRVFEILDHSAIYLLIAGTYTPFALATIRGAWGWSIFGVVWGLAVAGIVMQTVFPGRFRGIMTGLYIAMGWVGVVAFKPMVAALAPSVIALIAAGGICYTVGVYFYYRKRFRFSHSVWHVFVLAGSACHYFAVLRHVVD
jgi:hemolysin III